MWVFLVFLRDKVYRFRLRSTWKYFSPTPSKNPSPHLSKWKVRRLPNNFLTSRERVNKLSNFKLQPPAASRNDSDEILTSLFLVLVSMMNCSFLSPQILFLILSIYVRYWFVAHDTHRTSPTRTTLFIVDLLTNYRWLDPCLQYLVRKRILRSWPNAQKVSLNEGD